MLNFQEFFTACSGTWQTDRIYHYPIEGEVERSYTEFTASALDSALKQEIFSAAVPADSLSDKERVAGCPGFRIEFNTTSEYGEKVSMKLSALFVPESAISTPESWQTVDIPIDLLPAAAQVPVCDEIIRGWYLRDEGYTESGSIAGKFTYMPSRATLEMTTYYNKSVAVDRMRFLNPDLRERTIVTYKRPPITEVPTIVNLIGFGVERKV
jgi:hypothetical protein